MTATAPRDRALDRLTGHRTLRLRQRELRRAVFAPPSDLTVSQWAEEYRVISRGTSPEPGPWRNERTPYLMEIMDAYTDPEVERIVFKKSARVGGTEVINNIIGFTIDQEPTSILVMQPGIEDAKGWSKEQLGPMLRDTPTLRDVVRESGRREPENTLQTKMFPGGLLVVIGSNSAAGLRRRNMQTVIGDEVDAYGLTARAGHKTEGDPWTLGIKRSENYPSRKIFETSTPTIDGQSRIQRDYAFSDQREYLVPCPHCGHEQTFKWSNIRWEKGRPETVRYLCGRFDADTGELFEGCGMAITEDHKEWMVRRGRWEATHPGRRIRGYFIWQAYSLLTTWSRMVEQWEEAQGDRLKLQVFVNTVLGEEWKEHAQELDADVLGARRGDYGAEVPHFIGVLTAGVDVQGDRLEVTVWGFGAGMERAVIHHENLWGDPAQPDVWNRLDLHLFRSSGWSHESGVHLPIRATAVDSGGHHTDAVYGYCDRRRARNVWPVKGASTPGAAPVKPPGKRSDHRLWIVGTDALKDMIYAGLKDDVVPGPGYIHFPRLPDEYFRQLTGEVVRIRYSMGRPVRRYEPKTSHQRVEALDCAVYAHAALLMLGPVRDQLGKIVEEIQVAGAEGRPPRPVLSRPRRGRRVRSRGMRDEP